MVQYSFPQNPEIILTVAGKDSAKAREKAMAQLIDLMDAGKLDAETVDGLDPQQLVEVGKEPLAPPIEADDPIAHAVQTLSTFAGLKLKIQELQADATQVRSQIDILFGPDPVTEAQINALKDGFKTLKTYAQLHHRLQEVLPQAEVARSMLDRALSFTPTPLRNLGSRLN
ncbi:MAG: hypothetical protein HC919_02925 [Oscillatoriales cyanobacterium SM2_2_1]|nr:hypothetical protein [Oscillatoriales cyanobacterium SM2_2_1]